LYTGYQVVVDDTLFSDWERVGLGPWHRVMAQIEVDLVALMPDWEVALARVKAVLFTSRYLMGC
jgi:hypothetical protein